MYLISIYFDQKSDRQIQNYINAVERVTGNTFMTDNSVPPHITIAAFETMSENTAKRIFDSIAQKVGANMINWVSIGTFLPSVIYITPVLNEYLHNVCEVAYKELDGIEGVRVDKKYAPFNWIPHATIAKKLSCEQLRTAFEVLQNRFTVFESQVTKIGLARTNPFSNLKEIQL